MKSKPIYEVVKEDATNNIKLKLRILEQFIIDGIPWRKNDDGTYKRDPKTGFRELDFYPSNEYSFAKWTAESKVGVENQSCVLVRNKIVSKYGNYKSHGPDSLLKRVDLLNRARSIFSTLKTVEKNQIAKENNVDLIKKQLAEINHWKAAARNQAAYVVEAITRNSELERNIVKLERALNESKQVVATLIQEKNNEITKKDLEISELTKQIKQISSFKAIGNEKYK